MLYTASSDNTAMALTPQHTQQAESSDPMHYTPTLILQHPDFVRSITVVYPSSFSDPVVATACRDENVRLFDASDGSLLCIFRGHFEEVTDLLVRRIDVRSGTKKEALVSVSIDGTIRMWDLSRKAVETAAAVDDDDDDDDDEEEEEEEEEEEQGDAQHEYTDNGKEEVGTKGEQYTTKAVITDEEERELAALMEDD